MGELQKFLLESFHQLEKWKICDEIHIILGNEAGDLDSVMSTIGYGFFLRHLTKLDHERKIAFFPVLNFDREDMDMRFEHQFLFKQVGVNMDKLIYRSQLNFEEMVEDFDKQNKSFHTYLVDHHQLAEKDAILKHTVTRIFDHRPLDKYYSCVNHNLIMRLQSVASCSTLIANEIFQENGDILNDQLAYLLYCTIIYDMKGFSNPGTLDEEIKSRLKTRCRSRKDPKRIYRLLEDLHSKIEGLTPLQILRRDLKFQNGILFPRLSMSAREFIKLDGAYNDLENLCLQYNSHLAVLICGIKKIKGSNCDVAVFFSESDDIEFMNKFVEKLKAANMAEVKTDYRNYIIFDFSPNRKLGRKKMLPFILNIHKNIRGNGTGS